MQLGMPVVALATTEAVDTVPPEAGTVSTKVEVLGAALRELIDDHDLALRKGKEARRVALARHNLPRFLGAWDKLLSEVAG
jgi:glycosyltransferase involved in cell wall biosynthesis